MFSRSKSPTASTSAPSAAPGKDGGKGRPTPSRKEAEAAAKARAKVPRTKKEVANADRANRRRALDGLKSGNEKYLPARDKGPVKAFIRDVVDSRFSFTEVMIPVLLVSMILSYSGNPSLMNLGNVVLLATLAMVVVDGFAVHYRVRKEMGLRFPEESRKGTTRYALARCMQMRFMRLPKPQVRIGGKLPENYR